MDQETIQTDFTNGEDGKGTRERSTIRFSYIDLDSAADLARSMHSKCGLTCAPEQLAAASGHDSVRSGQFMRKVGGAQVFGLLEREGELYKLTEIGRLVSQEETANLAKARAFLQVDLYRAMYEQFKGGPLPQNSGIEHTMKTMGVAPKQAEVARQVFQKSAEQAGFCAYGKDRLVLPSVLNQGATDTTQDSDAREKSKDKPKGGTVHHQSSPLHPMIQSLINEIPTQEEGWTQDDLDKWMTMWNMTVQYVYGVKAEISVDRLIPGKHSPAKNSLSPISS